MYSLAMKMKEVRCFERAEMIYELTQRKFQDFFFIQNSVLTFASCECTMQMTEKISGGDWCNFTT